MGTGRYMQHFTTLNARSIERIGRAAIPTADVADNQQILTAAQQHYAAHYPAVDTTTTQGSQYLKSPENQQQLQTLRAYDWRSGTADSSVASPVYSSAVMAPAVSAAQADGSLATMVIGVSESLTLLLGESGGIGIGFDFGPGARVGGVGYVEGRFGLDIDIGVNLQLGLWVGNLDAIAGPFIGLELDIPAGEIVGMTLGVYMSPSLDLIGFSGALGVGIGLGAAIVAGNTWVF